MSEDAKAEQIKKKRGRVIRDIEARDIKIEFEAGQSTDNVVVRVRRSKRNGTHRASVEIRGAKAKVTKIERK